VRRLLLLAVLLVPVRAHAADRLDHRGALGLELGAGYEHASVSLVSDPANLDVGRLTLDLAPTFGVGTEGNELVALIRLVRGPDWGGALAFGYRAYFGREEWKTFFQGSIKADTAPHWAIGPDANVGVMFELSSLFGFFAEIEVSVEGGQGLRVGLGGSAGFQLRSYLLE
jgi:hypothetical protein